LDARSLALAALSAGCSGGVMASCNIFLHTLGMSRGMEWWRTHLGLGKSEWPERAQLRERARAARDLAIKEAHIRHNYALAAAEMAMAHHRHPQDMPARRPNEFTTNWRQYFGIRRNHAPTPASLQATIRNKYTTLVQHPHTQNDLRKHAFLAEFARRRLKHPLPLQAPANRPANRPALGIPIPTPPANRPANRPENTSFQGRVRRRATQMKHAWGAFKPHLFQAGVMGHRMVQSKWWKERGRYM
jgi:hypothetical protein